MPIHDWTKVRANRFHAFHQDWTVEIARSLNRGLLPEGYTALPEQRTGLPEGDVVTLSLPKSNPLSDIGGIAIAERPVTTRFRQSTEAMLYADKSNAVRIYHPDGDVVAVIEIVSPGNKDRRFAIKQFCQKAARYLRNGINLLIVDLFPPNKQNPQGIHPLIWERVSAEEYAAPADKPLTVVSYRSGDSQLDAYVEPIAVGDELPEMPVFLNPDRYILCPLASTYQTSWDLFPKMLKAPLLESAM